MTFTQEAYLQACVPFLKMCSSVVLLVFFLLLHSPPFLNASIVSVVSRAHVTLTFGCKV